MEEEEEESEDEDVFAYLPPSTADQQQQQLEQQGQHGNDYQQQHLVSPQIVSPPPTFDPNARYPANSPRVPDQFAFARAYSNYPVETPPSTDSQQDPDDPYRMRRVSSIPPTPTTGRRSFSPRSRRSSQATREVSIDLPSRDEKLDVECTAGSSKLYRKRRESGDDDGESVSVTPSMLDYVDGDSRSGSIK